MAMDWSAVVGRLIVVPKHGGHQFTIGNTLYGRGAHLGVCSWFFVVDVMHKV